MSKPETNLQVASVIEESRVGGPQIRMVRIGRLLANFGIHNIVICPRLDSGKFQFELSGAGIDYCLVWLTRLSKQPHILLRYLLFFPFEVINLSRILRRGNFDVVHICGGAWQFKGVLAARLAGKRAIWHLNDTYMPSFIRYIFGMFSKMVDGYIYASDATERYYSKYVEKSRVSSVIRQPVDTALFNKANIHEIDADTIPFTGKKIIGTLANINPVKDLETFIRVAAQVNRKVNDAHFIIGGPVPSSQQGYYSKLCDLVAELGLGNVTFLGSQSDSRMFYSRCDIFLCTSRFEAGPMTVWEAMSMEVPVVSTRVGDVEKFLVTGLSGDVVDVGDVEALSRKILNLLEKPGLRRTYGINARKIIVEEFDVNICAKKHADIYHKIAAT